MLDLAAVNLGVGNATLGPWSVSVLGSSAVTVAPWALSRPGSIQVALRRIPELIAQPVLIALGQQHTLFVDPALARIVELDTIPVLVGGTDDGSIDRSVPRLGDGNCGGNHKSGDNACPNQCLRTHLLRLLSRTTRLGHG